MCEPIFILKMRCLHFKHSIVGPDLSSNANELILSTYKYTKT